MTQNQTNRIDWVDTGKFICILFVMLSHPESITHVPELFYTPFNRQPSFT